MTIKELITKKDYDYVSCHLLVTSDNGGQPEEVFAGVFRSEKGEIVSLDGDSYSKEKEVVRFEEWSNEEDGIKNGLTIVCRP